MAAAQRECLAVADIDLRAFGGDDEIVEREIDRRHLHMRFVERLDADHAVVHGTYDLMVHQDADAEWTAGRLERRAFVARARYGLCPWKGGAQPVIGAVSSQATELARHRARDRLATIDDVVDRLTRDTGGLADRDLVEAEPLDFRPEMFARGQIAACDRPGIPEICGHRTLLSQISIARSRPL